MKSQQVTTIPRRNADSKFTPTDDQILLFNEIVLILKPYSKLMRVMVELMRVMVEAPTVYEIWTEPLIRSQAMNRKEGATPVLFLPGCQFESRA